MVTVRPVEEKDTLFIEALYGTTREKELQATNWPEEQKKAFIVMQSMAQLSDYQRKFPGAIYQIIVYRKKDVGRIYTCETDHEIRLIDITLHPEVRGKGIGTYLIGDLIRRSDATGKKISLHVDPENPALHLYSRSGFVFCSKTGRLHYMERYPEKK
jgi:ribosomal protein S18 acetylase RimI-like enzyme